MLIQSSLQHGGLTHHHHHHLARPRARPLLKFSVMLDMKTFHKFMSFGLPNQTEVPLPFGVAPLPTL